MFDQTQLHKCSHNQVWDLLTNIKAEVPQWARFFNAETAEQRRDFLSFISVDLVNTPAALQNEKKDDVNPLARVQNSHV